MDIDVSGVLHTPAGSIDTEFTAYSTDLTEIKEAAIEESAAELSDLGVDPEEDDDTITLAINYPVTINLDDPEMTTVEVESEAELTGTDWEELEGYAKNGIPVEVLQALQKDGALSAADDFAGKYDSGAQYMEELTRESSEIPDFLDYYIDWKSMWSDEESNYYVVEHRNSVYIFHA